MITAAQRREIEGREQHRLRVFSGDVYAPQPNGSWIAIDPEGNIRVTERPARGVTLANAEASYSALTTTLANLGDGETMIALTEQHVDTIRAGLRCLAHANPEQWADRVELADARIVGAS